MLLLFFLVINKYKRIWCLIAGSLNYNTANNSHNSKFFSVHVSKVIALALVSSDINFDDTPNITHTQFIPEGKLCLSINCVVGPMLMKLARHYNCLRDTKSSLLSVARVLRS